jgi:3',5'-cyclic AMP phosphodiesterase CpdA
MTRASAASRALASAAVAALALAYAPPAAARLDGSPCNLSTSDRIVAVGDVHGAFDQVVKILQAARVIDGRQRWSAGSAVLVQTGDLVDRGADSRRVLDLLRRLEGEAERAGGRVVALVGNHEVMGMVGDLRYVSAGEYESFRTVDSESIRERVSAGVSARAESAARSAGEPFDRDGFLKLFMSQTPLGSIERQIAFGPDGQYGRWLRARETVVKINGVLFLHGGISPATAALGCEGINETVRTELKEMPVDAARLSTFLSTREDGPLWYRGLAAESEGELAGELATMLERLQARAIVIGHTVAPNGRIATRFGGRVVQIDTGMLGGTFYPGGRASALEIQDGRFVAIYENGREPLPIRLITRNDFPSRP